MILPYRGARVGNEDLADAFERVADLLGAQNGNPFRARAYAHAAARIRSLDRPVRDILNESGPKALEELPDIGPGLAAASEAYVRTGRLPLLERLEGEVCPEALFMTVPGIGEKLAGRIHEHLGVETLEALELAAHDGRLETVPGFGPRRARAVRETLSSMLGRASRRRALRRGSPLHDSRPHAAGPAALSVADLLDVDRRYRDLAERDALPRIAPRRFNPEGERWLPLYHTTVGSWDVTALYSNTALAHRLGRTRDWVVIYADLDDVGERYTVVTERRGPAAGLRVVRGREDECARYYAALPGEGATGSRGG